MKLYVTNALAIAASLGLLIPWAVLQDGTLFQFQGSDATGIAAFGAETIDIFDMDLSL